MTPSLPDVTIEATEAGGVLQTLADVGTFLAALATVVVVLLTLRTLRALHEQVKVGQDAATAARESADAAEDAVREAAKTRIDDQAPRVVVLIENPEWPPFIDRSRSSAPVGADLSLLDTLGQSSVANSTELYQFDAHKSWFLWFRTRGVLINEGKGTARVSIGRAARFIEGESRLLGQEVLHVPPRIGTDLFPEYILRPGEKALLEWGDGHTLGDWADARDNPDPPNPHGACILRITVFDWLSSGVVDHHYVLLQGRPIWPVPNMQGQWRLLNSPHMEVGLTSYPPNRTYRAYHEEGAHFAPAPWEPVFAEWNELHGP